MGVRLFTRRKGLTRRALAMADISQLGYVPSLSAMEPSQKGILLFVGGIELSNQSTSLCRTPLATCCNICAKERQPRQRSKKYVLERWMG